MEEKRGGGRGEEEDYLTSSCLGQPLRRARSPLSISCGRGTKGCVARGTLRRGKKKVRGRRSVERPAREKKKKTQRIEDQRQDKGSEDDNRV